MSKSWWLKFAYLMASDTTTALRIVQVLACASSAGCTVTEYLSSRYEIAEWRVRKKTLFLYDPEI